jgi:hypothetical protein
VLSERPQAAHSTGSTNRKAWRYSPKIRSVMSTWSMMNYFTEKKRIRVNLLRENACTVKVVAL